MSELTKAEQRRIVQRARFGTFLVNEYIKPTSQTLSRSIPRLLSDSEIAELTRRELNALSSQVRKEFIQNWDSMWLDINNDLERLAANEMKFTAGLYSEFTTATFAIPKIDLVLGAINNSIMSLTSGQLVQSGTWAQFINRNKNSTYSLIDGIIKLGWRDGVTNQDIVTQLRGKYNRKTKQYEGGVLNGAAVNRAETLARTGTSHYSAVARDELMQANSDIIESRILYATFDSRTSDICIARHLQEWDIEDDNYPRLPFHFNERSVYLFRIDGETPFTGKRASKGAEGGQQVDADLTMTEWLKSQPKSFVVETLGKTRAELFLDGGLSINKFVDMQGRKLSLAELESTTDGAKAFKKAGLSD